MHQNALIALHIAPASAFGEDKWKIGPEQWKARWHAFQPRTVHGGLTYEFHADGFVAREINNSEGSAAYSLLFRDGTLELVYWVGRLHENQKFVPAVSVESTLVGSLCQFFPVLQSFGLSPPYLVSFALLKAKGHRLGVGDMWDDPGRAFERDVYAFPWRTVTELSEDPAVIMRPSLDALWNAAGYEKSTNYTERDQQRSADQA